MELSDLIESIDIVDYISQFVDLTEKGGEFWGLSPFKDEKTPSFSVRREANNFYDFSSGIGGNVFTFTKYFFKCSGREAVEKLKEYAGVEGDCLPASNKLASTAVCKRFSKPCTHEKVEKSKPLPQNCMEKYEKVENKLAVWKKEGISDASLTKFQVYYDGFSDRLVYPIRNPAGEIVNIGGRTLDPDYKEKKLRKYTYFNSWGTINTIYGLAENKPDILRQREIVLFEGCKSVLLADTWGIHNTGAILTSHLSQKQMKILAGLGVRVVFALDKDVDITADRHISALRQYCNVFYIKDTEGLIGDKDSPVDKGLEVYKTLYEKKIRYRT